MGSLPTLLLARPAVLQVLELYDDVVLLLDELLVAVRVLCGQYLTLVLVAFALCTLHSALALRRVQTVLTILLLRFILARITPFTEFAIARSLHDVHVARCVQNSMNSLGDGAVREAPPAVTPSAVSGKGPRYCLFLEMLHLFAVLVVLKQDDMMFWARLLVVQLAILAVLVVLEQDDMTFWARLLVVQLAVQLVWDGVRSVRKCAWSALRRVV